VLIAAKVQIASLVIFADIENGSPQAASSLSVVLLLLALVILFTLRRWGTRVAH
jgi:ABC-type sulfate transport system permease component